MSKRNNRNNAPIKVTLTRNLLLFDVTMIGIGAMIGAGIFVLTGLAAGRAGPALLLPIQDVTSAAGIIFMLLFVMVNASLITLRRRSDVERPFRAPLIPLFPLLGIVSQLLLCINLFSLSPLAWYTTLIWIALGTVFYAIYVVRSERMAEPVRIIHEEIVAVAGYSVLIPVAGPAEARMLGNLGSAVAREAATTVTRTKRYWRLKSVVGRLVGGPG